MVIINNLYNLKKIISLILISCIFTQLIVTDVKATTYEEENIISINSIGISNNEIEYPSGSTEVFVDINSEIVIDELYLCYENPYLGRYQEVYMEYNKENNRFEGRIYPEYKVEEEESYNEYLLQSINIWSNGDFYVLKRDSCEFQGVDFTQLDYSIVKWIPKINSIKLEKNQLIQAMDSSKLEIDIEDADIIQNLYVLYDNSDFDNYEYKLAYNFDTGNFETDVDNKYISKYIFQSIIVTTIYNEEVVIDRDDLQNIYSLNSNILDYSVVEWIPQINNIKLEKNELIQYRESSIIQVDIDEADKIKDVYINYCSDDGYGYNYDKKLKYNSTKDLFEGNIDTNNIANYKFNEIRIITIYDTQVSIYREELENRYSINTESLDYKVKEWMLDIKNFNIDKNTINISMNIKEYYDITSIKVLYSRYNNISNVDSYEYNAEDDSISYPENNKPNKPNINYPVGVEVINLYYNEETGLFEGNYKLNISSNEWICNYIYGVDISTKYGEDISLIRNNLIDYGIDVDDLDIKVKSFIPKSIEIDNKTVTYGKEANLKIDLSNYPKEIEEIEIKYNEYYDDEPLRVIYKLPAQKDNMYLVKFTVGSFTAEGLRKLSSISIKNYDGTVCEIIANGNPNGIITADLSAGDFYIKSSLKYMLYPMNVYTSKNIGQADENIKITVENVKMNVDTMKIIYVNTQSQKEIVSLMNYDSKINKWTGDFNIDKDLDEGIWIIDRIILGEYIDGRYESQDINNIYLYPVEKYIKDFSKADIEVISSDIDLLAPEAPKIYTVVNNKTTTIEGIAEPNATIIIEKELKIFSGVKIEEVARTVSDKNGLFKVNIPMQNINTNLGIKAVDACGNTSEYTNIIVKNINKEDVNYDEVVDILDLALVARKYNTLDGESLWDTNLDINEDGIVDIFDIAMISKKMK